MNNVKELVNGLNLDKYYGDFQRDDSSHMFIVEIYAYHVYTGDGDVVYIGNVQRPAGTLYDYSGQKYSLANYWLNGNSDSYCVIHRYVNTSNSLYHDGYGNKLANQKILNKIKQEIIDVLSPNFNVQILPEGYDIQTQFAKNISDYKKSISDTIARYKLNEFVNDLCTIISAIQNNYIAWHIALITKNRYWFISKSKKDIDERSSIKWDNLTDSQKATVIVMKEWLAMVVNESYVNQHYSMHINSIKNKLQNNKFKNYDLFNSIKSKFFEHKTAIKLILSSMYSKSSPAEIENVYSKYMNWRKNYITNIFK